MSVTCFVGSACCDRWYVDLAENGYDGKPVAVGVDHYDAGFFAEIRDRARRSADDIVPRLLDWVQPQSVVDIGCGVGTWLTVFQEYDIHDVLGIDGDYVDRNQLDVADACFRTADLSRPLEIERQFDLALCLEVAEHLPQTSAATLVHSLVQLSPVVLFSAAIPFQGGTHHVNEQWPGYWSRLFTKEGYIVIDCLRKQIWNNEQVSWWYAQNMLLFVRTGALDRYSALHELRENRGSPLSLVHPGKYMEVVWGERFWQSMSEFRELAPSGEAFVLIDDGQFYTRLDKKTGVVPFPEKDGKYCGHPPDGATALAELKRQHEGGARFVVILWPAFWWLEEYVELKDYLSSFTSLVRNERLLVYDMSIQQTDATQ